MNDINPLNQPSKKSSRKKNENIEAIPPLFPLGTDNGAQKPRRKRSNTMGTRISPNSRSQISLSPKIDSNSLLPILGQINNFYSIEYPRDLPAILNFSLQESSNQIVKHYNTISDNTKVVSSYIDDTIDKTEDLIVLSQNTRKESEQVLDNIKKTHQKLQQLSKQPKKLPIIVLSFLYSIVQFFVFIFENIKNMFHKKK